jgi:hypothetical protein
MRDPKRIYRRLLKLYPVRFREEYSAPMERQFADEYRETYGRRESAAFWIRALRDLAVSVPLEFARELGQDLRYSARVYGGRAEFRCWR